MPGNAIGERDCAREWERARETQPGTTVWLGTSCNTGGSWERGWERPIFPISSVLFPFLGLFLAILKFYKLNELKIQIKQNKLH